MKHLSLILILAALFLSACSNKQGDKDASAQGKQLYTCTMHPQVISDHPGVCPICGMELVKKAAVAPKEDNNNSMAGMLAINGSQAVLANVSTVKVKKENLNKQLSAFSYIDFAEENRKMITARFNGRIEKLYVNKTGDYIRKGENLFEIYSPDLVQAQNEFLIALNNSGQGSSNVMLKSARKKLEIFGVTDSQIKNLETTKEVNLTLSYYSPFSGTVIEKKAEEGMYVSEGSEIYDIADLSTVWNTADVFEKDLSTVKIGSKVTLKLQYYPGENFEGRVAFIYPVVNSQTRTIKVRTIFANHSGKLKPQMYGQTIFENELGSGLVVPEDAILFTGKGAVVWLKTPDGMYVQKEVTVGVKINNEYQILSGLKEGQEVAATGGFLLDSESQLKGNNNSSNKSDTSKNNSGSMPGMKM